MNLYKLIQIGLILSIVIFTACSDYRRTYTIGTSAQEQAYRDLGKALQTELQRRGKLKLKTVETKGSMDNLKRLRSGELDFALIQGGLLFDDAGLLLIAAVDTEYLHIVVPVSSEIKDLSDLAGKRVAAGIEGTGSRLLAERIAAAANFSPPIELIPMTRDSIATQLIGGDIDAAMFVTDLRRELEPLFAGGQFRLAGIKAADALSQLLFDVNTEVIPAGVYGKNLSLPPAPTSSLAVNSNLVVRADVPNRAVTKVIEALYDFRVRRDARLPGLSENAGRVGIEMTLHQAAEAYYTRKDPITSDQFEIAAFFLAALIAAASLIRFLWAWQRGRGKTHKKSNVRADGGINSEE